MAWESDMAKCEEIAVSSFAHDRLHADDSVSKEDADEAKRAWVRRAFASGPPVLKHFDVEGNPEGFLIVKVDQESVTIDLLAVDERYRRFGVARKLVYAALGTYPGREFLRAGTQKTNEPARRFYASLGMRVVKTQRTFHKDAP